MKTIEVHKIKFKKKFPSLEEISIQLDNSGKRYQIDTINWKEYAYKPAVAFALGYTDNEILLKYYITEEYFKAEKTETNQRVCEDSCVEFFVSPEDDGIYYNLEFNGITTCLLGTGTCRENSKKADADIISKIRRLSSAGETPVTERKGTFSWTITIAIPFEVFFHHKITSVKGKSFKANFYKCGDTLSVPHYVTWNPVGTQNPDYHQPGYFGTVKFV
jgi:hypothetical protein